MVKPNNRNGGRSGGKSGNNTTTADTAATLRRRQTASAPATFLLALVLREGCSFHITTAVPTRHLSTFRPQRTTRKQDRSLFRVLGNARWAGSGVQQDAAEQVPDVLRDVIVETIEDLGGGKVTEVKETTAGPGLHNRHFKYTATGGTFMAKLSKSSSLDNFVAERAGLEAILATGCLRAPKPLAHGSLSLGGSFLLMEHMPFIPFGQSIPEVLKHLAEGLAEMHLRDPPPDVKGFGFHADNFLGPSPQDNSWKDDFSTFMVEKRLLPQFERAYEKSRSIAPDLASPQSQSASLVATSREIEGMESNSKYGTSNEDASAFRSMGAEVFMRAKEVLATVADARPALLHGDLWVGNCGGVPAEGRSREAAVFDPACWYGVPEFDLALATMFGGFGAPFYETYHAIIPKAEGFEKRMRIYKLYHYLNHFNLHGAGFGHGGTVEDPRGYYERCVGLMKDIVADDGDSKSSTSSGDPTIFL